MIDHSTKQFVSSAPSTDWMFVWQIGTVAYTTIFLIDFFLCMIYSRCYNKDISKEQTEGSKNNIGKKTAVKKMETSIKEQKTTSHINTTSRVITLLPRGTIH